MPHELINGVRLWVETHGETGEPLVLVHGYTGDITDWRYQVAEFSKTHRVLMMELRGHGRSDAPADRGAYAIGSMVDDVAAVIAHAGLDRYHLVGHSMGGAIAQEIALRNGDRLLSLTLEDTGPSFSSRPDGVLAKFNAYRHRVAEEQGMPAVAALQWPVAPPPHQTEERRQEERERLARMSVDAFIGASHALSEWPGTKDRLHEISVPTLVICGALDTRLLRGAERLARDIPGAVLEIISEAGHAPQYERPDLFNAALRTHLERTASPRKDTKVGEA